jgi:hypothetical protein
MFIYLCILKLYHALPCVHVRLCMLFLTYMVKIKTYDSGTPEEFLKWRLTLNDQVKNNGYVSNYDNVMNLAQAMLAGRSLEAFLNERRAQEAKNRIRKAKTQTEHTPSQIYDFAIFELAIRAFDIQSGWRDAYERQSIWILFLLKKQVTTTKLPGHMESHCQKMKSGPLWDEQSHLNGQ